MKIVGVIGSKRANIVSLAKMVKEKGADLLEIRFDKVKGGGDDILLVKEIKKVVGLPVIATKRPKYPGEDRKIFFKSIIPFIDYIDLEEEEEVGEIIEYAKKMKKSVIISYHNYKKTPSIKTLKEFSISMEKKGADIIKIATFVNCPDDILKLLNLTKNCKKPIITIGMGKLGTITRVIAPMFGSIFTYCFVNRPYAPGQVSISFLKKETKKYGLA